MAAAFGGSEDAGGDARAPSLGPRSPIGSGTGFEGMKAPAPRRQILHSVQNDMGTIFMGAIFRGMTAKGAARWE